MFGGLLGFHSRDETATLVYKARAKRAQVLHQIVLFSNMAAVTSHENQEYGGKFALPNRLC